ncbi:PAS domain-containing sensor histidine kinase [Megalodesulfovibrio gigas]|uniref:histidine kinase n=1 Tax=Megalodesulfovibrio gigas (strain ATCC 19364 / DSM 1382 / NCIMB 9332 / VKM B-1759) TaxID=1121448 RepID=T2GCL2_MEGG1|nr:PAS domain-containing sensor histidine kinase [Megalodesulfovibrio gigas]AGW14038.1 putative PAS/PAC sensor signal transduction histidine kinase [Megalodesulfovibrio gigas DSM 1382 = ATCC 19364]
MPGDSPTPSGLRFHFSRHSLQIVLFAGVFVLLLNGFFIMHYRQSRAQATADALARLEQAAHALADRFRLLQADGTAPDQAQAALQRLLPPQGVLILESDGGPQEIRAVDASSTPLNASLMVATVADTAGSTVRLEQPRAAAMHGWQLGARKALTGMVLANALIAGLVFFLGLFAARARRWQAGHKHSEEMLVALFENANQFVALLDPAGTLLKVNQAALQCIDAPRDSVLGLEFWRPGWWRVPQEAARTRQAVMEALAGRPSHFQSQNVDARGRAFPVDVSVKPLIFEHDHVEYILVEWRDISDLVAAAKALEESRGQLMDMAASVPGVLFRLEEVDPAATVLSQRFRFAFISQRLHRLFHLNPELATLDCIANLMHPTTAFLESLQRAIDSPPRWEHLSQFTDRAGRTGWVRIRARVKPLKQEDGSRLVINGVFLDETEHIEAEEELKKAHSALQEQEKMVSLGSMVAGVAHEINTPLGVALTAASQLDKDVTQVAQAFDDQTLTAEQMTEFIADASEATRLMVANCTRAADLVRSFKQVAADQSVQELRAIDLKEYLDDLVLSLRPQLKRTPHTLEVDCPELLNVVCDPGALAQIVSNLVMNSLNHAFNGTSGAMRLGIVSAPASDMVTLRFEDNGLGMPEAVRRRAFDPFFTTRRGQGGTGLGLHIVYNLVVNSLGGTITLDSTEGKGTAFTITFPRTPAPTA